MKDLTQEYITETEQPKLSDGWIGKPQARIEDDRLLRGQSRYVSDIATGVDALHVVFLRSPHAHAELRRIDTTKARSKEGVQLILTNEDLRGAGSIPADWVPDGMLHEALHRPLAEGKVRYVGEPIVAVVASEKHLAQSALDHILVEYAPLPPVTNQEKALEEGAPRLHEESSNNLALKRIKTAGDFDKARRKADVIVTRRLTNNRLAPSSMEGRAVLSSFDPATHALTHHTSTQLPHLHARDLARCLDLPMNKLRLISPDVGGGFGGKLGFYPEDVVIAEAARRLGRPCLWVQSRTENLISTTHGRDHVQYVELAARKDGTITGIKTKIIADLGAYALGMGPGVPAINAALTVTGPYRIENVISEMQVVYTNRVPTGPYRGAGHPEATFLIERMIDELAVELHIDPAKIRRRNFIPPTIMPYKLPLGFVVDGGDYKATLDKALELAGYDYLRDWQARAREEGRYVGVGIASYAETSGAGPSIGMSAVGFRRSGHESARVVMHPDGRATVFSGGHSHGQGHATSLAQIAAQTLGIAIQNVEVVQGDTAIIPFGTGTYNSRTMAVGGTAVMKAAESIVTKLRRIAAIQLRTRPADVVLADGVFSVGGNGFTRQASKTFRYVEEKIKDTVLDYVSGFGPLQVTRGAKTMTIAQAAYAAHLGHDLPLDMAPGLDETVFFDPKDMPAAHATHLSVVEVDPKTGHIGLLRHIVVDDCGTIINPLLATGQVHGGAAQGIGQALMEWAQYDQDGLPMADSLMGYAMPRATDLPAFETAHTVSPTWLNPMGVKGIGEGATIGAPPALVNAVLDALRPEGVTDIRMPMTPENVWSAVREAQGLSVTPA